MNWLGSIAKALFSALFDWGQKQAEKPETIENANTPKDIRDANSRSFVEWLRNKKGGSGGQ